MALFLLKNFPDRLGELGEDSRIVLKNLEMNEEEQQFSKKLERRRTEMFRNDLEDFRRGEENLADQRAKNPFFDLFEFLIDHSTLVPEITELNSDDQAELKEKQQNQKRSSFDEFNHWKEDRFKLVLEGFTQPMLNLHFFNPYLKSTATIFAQHTLQNCFNNKDFEEMDRQLIVQFILRTIDFIKLMKKKCF